MPSESSQKQRDITKNLRKEKLDTLAMVYGKLLQLGKQGANEDLADVK